MTQEALKLALDALIWTTGSGDFGEGGYAHEGAKKCLFPAITAIKKALTQPEQAPVGFAGVKIWVGNQQVVKLLTQTELDLAIEPCGLLEQAAEMCIEELKGAV